MITTSTASLLLGMLGLMLPVTGILMALTPYLMPKRECFAVTVPDGAVNDPYLRKLKRTYLVAMLVLVSVFIISNTIKIATFTRREEIAVLRMCGASNWFIRWPFLVEGVLLGLVGAVLAYLAEWGIYGLIQRAMENSGILSIITTVPFSQLAYIVMLVFLVVGFAIGAGGSALAIRKFLKV